MSDPHSPEPDQSRDPAPEARNRSQDDAPDQAQSLADEALGLTPMTDAEESERVPSSDVEHGLGPQGLEDDFPRGIE